MASGGYWDQPNVTTYGGGSSDQGAGYQALGTPKKRNAFGAWYGGTGAGAAGTSGLKRSSPVSQSKPQGVLSGPTNVNQIYDRFKQDPNRSYFQPRTQSYTAGLLESGNQGLNKYYAQARDEGQAAIRGQLSSMGLLGSSTTAEAVTNLNAKLGAQYGRDMAGLSQAADTAESNRIGDYWSGWESEMGLGDKADTSLERRETMPLQAKERLAGQMSGIAERFSSANATEQLGLFEQIIQAGIANGTTDRIHADQWAEDLFKTYGIIIRASDLRGGGTAGTESYPVSNPEILPPSR